MASQIEQIKKVIKRGQPLTLRQRFVLVLLIICIQMLYIPTSTRTFGGIEPRLPIDIFPVWAVWVLPYVMCYPLWLTSLVWAIFKMEDELFRSLSVAFLLTSTISIAIFIFFPTYVRPVALKESDIFTSLLLFLQKAGKYDAFPSGHIYITVLLALFYNLWYPRYKFYWVLIPIVVSFSTLFTHQHYVVDIVGGLVVALLGFHFGLRWAGLASLRDRTDKRRLLLPPP